MALRVTLSSLLSSTALSGAQRVSAQLLITAYPIAADKRVSEHLMVSSAALAGAKRVTAHYLISAISINELIVIPESELILIRLESRKHIFGISRFAYELASFPIPEHNPYRPRIPAQFSKFGDDMYDFFEENQQIIRQQHNITQAGDSTFPFQIAADTHTDPLYKVGAVGRFYHEQYGIIQARYVKFDKMKVVGTPHCPVGLFKKATSLDWTVTNNIDLSDPGLVVGVSMPFALPTNGEYGWVITDGPILQSLKNNSTSSAIGESLVWDGSGSVSNSAEGKVLGRRVNKATAAEDPSLLAGQMWVRTESLSEASIAAVANTATQDLRDAVTAIQGQVSDLPAATELAALNSHISALQNALNVEVSARLAADVAIQALIAADGGVTSAELDNAIAALTSAYQLADTNLQLQLAALQLAQTNAAPLIGKIPGIVINLQNLTAAFTTEANRVHGRFPVVDGAVPPNLVYMDDGSLVYLETI